MKKNKPPEPYEMSGPLVDHCYDVAEALSGFLQKQCSIDLAGYAKEELAAIIYFALAGPPEEGTDE